MQRITPWGVLILLLLTGCAWVQAAPLPTRMPVAVLPTPATPQTNAQIVIPATFTPSQLDLATATAVPPTRNQPAIPITPLALPSPTPTPLVIPNFLATPQPPAIYLEAPPRTIPCEERGLLFRSRYPSDVGGPSRSYHAYLPPCYGEDNRVYPVLYLFHGSIQTDTHWVDLGLVGYIDAGIREGQYPPFIVIMPDNGVLGNMTSGNNHSIEGITVNTLIPFVDANFCTLADKAGRSIGGISRGGYWALMIAFRHTELFTAVSGHSSHLRLETDRAEYNPLATYAGADLDNLHIWMDWGEKDFLRPGQQELRDSLLAVGADLDVSVNPGGHNEAYWQTHIGEYLDWHAANWPRSRFFYPFCE